MHSPHCTHFSAFTCITFTQNPSHGTDFLRPPQFVVRQPSPIKEFYHIIARIASTTRTFFAKTGIMLSFVHEARLFSVSEENFYQNCHLQNADRTDKIHLLRVRVAELVDALDSGSSGLTLIGVQLPSLTPLFFRNTKRDQSFRSLFFVRLFSCGSFGKYYPP